MDAFCSLDGEIVYEICKFFPRSEQLNTLMLVSKRFYNIITIGLELEQVLIITSCGESSIIFTDSVDDIGDVVQQRLSYVLPSTVKIFLRLALKFSSVIYLKFDLVILDLECLELLASLGLANTIKSLVIGRIKVISKNKYKISDYDVRNIPLLNEDGLIAILSLIGHEVKYLQLDTSIGAVSNILSYAPKLLTLSAIQSTSIIPCEVKSLKRNIVKNGPVNPEDLRNAFATITVSDLLITMKVSENEPMILVDPKGYIIVCNEAFESISGYYNDDVYMTLWHQCLPSQLTEHTVVDNINHLMKEQSEYAMEEIKSIAITNKEGKSFICQMVLLLNVIKYKGMKLDKNALTYNEISRIQSDLNRKNDDNEDLQEPVGANETLSLKQVIASQRINAFHLIRFGFISESFSIQL